MKVLISAYACEPGKGSEPEVGLQIAMAAAQEHDVWVITRENNIPPLSLFLAGHPFEQRIHLIGLDLSGRARRWKSTTGLPGLHLYYDMWQRRLGLLAKALDLEHDFDVVHHATFATYWTRAGITTVDKPLIWGPVGGGVTSPIRHMPSLGVRGFIEETARLMLRPLAAWLAGARRTAKRAAVVFCQNPETARRLSQSAKTIILPNALAAVFDEPDGRVEREPNRLIAAGRLTPWKGYHLLLRALATLPPEFELDLYGDGPDRRRLERLAHRLGIESRVRFRGLVPREVLLQAMQSASVFVHPALHDESPLGVFEALTCGTPTVVLDRGGPAVIASSVSAIPIRVVESSRPRLAARAIAEAVSELAKHRGPWLAQPKVDFSQALLSAYDTASSDSNAAG